MSSSQNNKQNHAKLSENKGKRMKQKVAAQSRLLLLKLIYQTIKEQMNDWCCWCQLGHHEEWLAHLVFAPSVLRSL